MSENTPANNELERKERVTGKVVKATLAGAVVDIGAGKLGVIPISQLRKEPVRRVEEVVKEGDSVVAWVRKVESGRIELTMIEPLSLDWRDLKKDMVVKGKVSKLEKFGAFVELGSERPGLLHVSEMSHDYVRRPEDVVAVGQEIEVKILEVDRRKKQIKLSMKALEPEAAPEPQQEKEEPEKPAPTAMEIALRKAMSEDADPAPSKAAKSSRPKKTAADREDMLTRTLETRPKSR